MIDDGTEAEPSNPDAGSVDATSPEAAPRSAVTGRGRLFFAISAVTGLVLIAAVGYALGVRGDDPGPSAVAGPSGSRSATSAPTGSPTSLQPEETETGAPGSVLAGGARATDQGPAGSPAEDPSEEFVGLESPTNLTITPISGSTIRLMWTDNSTGETGYLVTVSGGPGSERRLPADTTRYDVTGLAEDTDYCFTVAAYQPGGRMAAIGGCARTLLPLPAAPSNLRATVSDYHLIHLTWTDNSTNETGFRVGGSQGPIHDLPAGTTSYTYLAPRAVEQGAEHCLRVQSVNYAGSSAWTPWVCARTTPLPAAPTNVTATAISATAIRIQWSDNSAIETGYSVSTSYGLPTRYVPANTSSVDWEGLTPDTVYCFTVQATPLGGAGNVTACARTAPAPASDGP